MNENNIETTKCYFSDLNKKVTYKYLTLKESIRQVSRGALTCHQVMHAV